MSNNKRRTLLKSIAAGSGAVIAGKGLPESWSRPVVDSVLLPVHAQTSLRLYAGATAVVVAGTTNTGAMLARATDALLPEARAGGDVLGIFDSGCAQETATGFDLIVERFDDTPSAEVHIAQAEGLVPLTGYGEVTVTHVTCVGPNDVFTEEAQLIEATDSQIVVNLGKFGMVTIQIGGECPLFHNPDTYCPS